jgi:hypothetical protein
MSASQVSLHNPNRTNTTMFKTPLRRKLLVAALAPLLAVGPAHAGLFDALATKPPEPEPFDFALAQSDPAKLVADHLEIKENGDGIAKLKKVAIATLQVRWRKDLSAEAVAGGAAAGVDKQLKADTALYQRLTDGVYDRLVKALTARGIEVVDASALAAQPAYQLGAKAAEPSGHIEKFGSLSVSNIRDKVGDSQSGSSLFSRIANDMGGVPYYVHYATAAPGWNFQGLGGVGDRIVEPGTISEKLLEAAQGAGVGVLMLGFEVRLSNFTRSETKGMTFSSAKVAVTPMMRTQLLALRMHPEGARHANSFSQMYFDHGLQVEPRNRGTKRRGLVGALTNGAVTGYPWIELDGKVVVALEDGAEVTAVPGGFEAAFDKCMDAQMQLLMAAIDSKRARP